MNKIISIDDLPFSKAKQLAGMVERNKKQVRFRLPETGAEVESEISGEVREGNRYSKKAWLEIGGKRIFCRSTWEVNYARYLEWLKKSGQIKEWAYEPKRFLFEAIKRGNNSYLPDFRVTENDGRQYWVEIKGRMAQKDKTKIVRFMKFYPKERLVVVDSQAYNALARDLKGFSWWEKG